VKYVTIIFVLLAIALSSIDKSIAQNAVVYEVRGRVCNSEGVPIQFAHVVNINKKSACISDTSGRFRMLMISTDTVRISCIGYCPTGFTIRNLNLDNNTEDILLGDIMMTPKVYELSTVNVYAERWKSFLFDYTQLEKEDDPYYIKSIEHWKENIIDIDELRLIHQSARGVGFSLNFDFKRRRAEKKIAEFKRQELLNAEAAERYNSKVVSEITGMSIEDSEKFMFHFNLNREYILSKNDYDIYLLVRDLYKEYQRSAEYQRNNN